ncbi:MAG: response regulator [Spartobacteria bacterium]|nr:response regulator [Spartobacteria bacterium]
MPLILVVDDIPRNLQVVGVVLKDKGYQVAAATSGTQVLGMLKHMKPDLILLDIMMPEMDGYEVCRRIKEQDELKDIPIVFLSAKNEVEDVVKGFKFGAVDYITKPFNASELLARVNTHVALKRARDTEKRLIKQLRLALSQVKALSGLLPICSHCKKIRDDKGYWTQVEQYISAHSETQFTHGLCPDCFRELYPDLVADLEAEGGSLDSLH